MKRPLIGGVLFVLATAVFHPAGAYSQMPGDVLWQTQTKEVWKAKGGLFKPVRFGQIDANAQENVQDLPDPKIWKTLLSKALWHGRPVPLDADNITFILTHEEDRQDIRVTYYFDVIRSNRLRIEASITETETLSEGKIGVTQRIYAADDRGRLINIKDGAILKRAVPRTGTYEDMETYSRQVPIDDEARRMWNELARQWYVWSY